MKRIAIIVRDFSQLGGVEKVTENLFNLFKNFDFPVFKIVSLFNEHDGSHPNVDFLSSPNSKFRLDTITHYVQAHKITDAILQVQDVQEMLSINRLLKTSNVRSISVLHTSPHNYFKWYYPSKYSSIINFLRFVKRRTYWRIKNYLVLKSLVNESDKFVCVSDSARDEFIKIYNQDFEGKVITIENPNIVHDKIAPLEKQNMVVFAGRFSEEKQIDKMLQAWSLIENKSDWQFFLLGSGHLFGHISEYVKRFNISDVHLVGKVNNVGDYLAKSKITILFSMFEGFPTILLEAANHGNALIGLNSDGGTKDLVINEVNGILVESDDSNALKEALSTLMQNEAKLKLLAEGNKLIVDRYSGDNIIKKWGNVF